MLSEINKPRTSKKIPVKVLEEVKHVKPGDVYSLVWIDNNGINTPYRVTVC